MNKRIRKRKQTGFKVKSFKNKLIMAVRTNKFVTISPQRALLILQDLETIVPSSNKNTTKFLNYKPEDFIK